MKNSYAIFGAGGCARTLMPIAHQQLLLTESNFELIFLDDSPKSNFVNGIQVKTLNDWLNDNQIKRFLNIGIANGYVRKEIADRVAGEDVNYFDIRSPNVVKFDDVSIDEGASLASFVTLTCNISIGKHFHANSYSYVEHDCIIGNFVTFGPGVKCNGNVHVEDFVYVGSGAVIKQGTNDTPLILGAGSVIGMGAVVTKSVPPGAVVVGNPAQPIK